MGRAANSNDEELVARRVKYPRTHHLPWSPGVGSDDVVIADTSQFQGKEVVVSEKIDGENTTFYGDGHLHARSIDSKDHRSRSWAKGLAAGVSFTVPDGWRVCGENVYAEHSIRYENLPSFFFVFSVWTDENRCLSWDETEQFCRERGLETVPVLWRGVYDEDEIRQLDSRPTQWAVGGEGEGYVIRIAEGFSYDEFDRSVAKYVRSGHVQTDEHWTRNWRPNSMS